MLKSRIFPFEDMINYDASSFRLSNYADLVQYSSRQFLSSPAEKLKCPRT